ncbi:MAG TPA: asparagine synthase C-terminal domain-containing protein, partial [Elusimicrobiota bacterium]|nr:asparagine synthase C-terminal domain-containing protein [Elusimicrobiota bacterium]
RLAKERGVTVLLDGQGADELLGGYEQYFAPYVDSLRERGDLARLERELPRIRERYPLALVPPARALRDRLPFPLRRLLSRALGTGTNLLYGLRPEAAREVMRTAAAPRRPAYSRLADSLERDSFSRSLTSLLRYGDRNSMAHSREVRLPFCDHRIAELAFSLPPHLLMGDAQTKRLLRESMRGILPEPVRARWNKQGFRPPQDLWFRSPRMLEAAQDVFGSASFRSSRYWSAVWWQKALERTRRGELSLAWALWQPFIIESWKAQFLAPVAAARSRAASGRGA